MSLFLDVNQFFYSVVKDYENKTIDEIIEYFMDNECKGELTISKSDSKMRRAGWGHLVYRVKDSGHLELVDHDVDSSG